MPRCAFCCIGALVPSTCLSSITCPIALPLFERIALPMPAEATGEALWPGGGLWPRAAQSTSMCGPGRHFHRDRIANVVLR